jgi:sodium transport system permease protein
MIAVLPLLLYPLLGMSFLQISQFLSEHATKVLIIGLPTEQDLPRLVQGEHFATNLFTDPERAKILNVTVQSPEFSDEAKEVERAKSITRSGKYEVVVYFPESFNSQLAGFRKQLKKEPSSATSNKSEGVPDPVIYYNEAKEKSDLTFRRVQMVLQNWREKIVGEILSDSHLPAEVAKPFEVTNGGVAEPTQRQAALWSKVLPFVLLLWALTGAFYPAVDLCAGEKERGTLETLLCSPAERSEIVWGKLLTIMLFSIATAILNLLSMGFTGSFVLSMLPHNFGSPPYWAIPILLIALLPMAALFSALCLALAAFARSTKEGQYYLMPLVLVTMPLTMLPMSPGVELNLGNSLIPVTGVVLLLRSLLEGNWVQALPYIPPVVAVTLGCCLLAVRWAADQFNAESVLFRESERFDLALWLRRMMEDRGETPSVPQAVACGVLILMLQFFMNFAIPEDTSFVVRVAVPMLACILTPALLMTVMLTTNARRTLLLRVPSLGPLVAAVLLALFIHPLSFVLREVVEQLYPMPEGIAKRLNEMLKGTSTAQLLFFAAILPALCEELAFRGFILSGLRHLGHKWRAIIVSSLFFGIAHGVFQQSLIASLLGTVIAYVAIQTGSIVPGMIFHMLHNSLQILVSKVSTETLQETPFLAWLINPQALVDGDHTFTERLIYHWPIPLVALVGTAGILYWLHRLPYARSQEETLQESIEECDAKDVELSAASAAAGS